MESKSERVGRKYGEEYVDYCRSKGRDPDINSIEGYREYCRNQAFQNNLLGKLWALPSAFGLTADLGAASNLNEYVQTNGLSNYLNQVYDSLSLLPQVHYDPSFDFVWDNPFLDLVAKSAILLFLNVPLYFMYQNARAMVSYNQEANKSSDELSVKAEN